MNPNLDTVKRALRIEWDEIELPDENEDAHLEWAAETIERADDETLERAKEELDR